MWPLSLRPVSLNSMHAYSGTKAQHGHTVISDFFLFGRGWGRVVCFWLVDLPLDLSHETKRDLLAKKTDPVEVTG